MSCNALFPYASKATLAHMLCGKSLAEVPTPAAVINVAAARRNCERMLEACDELDLGWRAHVKTHKTAELTRLQVGSNGSRPVNIVVSTMAEAEFLQPLLLEYKSQGRGVNVLYGLPFASNALERFGALGRALGQDSISILIDDPEQLPVALALKEACGVVPHAYIKVDMGGRRAGVVVGSRRYRELVDAALDAHTQGAIRLWGLYTHAGHSYGGSSPAAAMRMLGQEVDAMLQGADDIKASAETRAVANMGPLVISAGASPTALSVQNMIEDSKGASGQSDGECLGEAASLAKLLGEVRRRGHSRVEVHAGVYATLDLQQLAAHSMASSRLSWRDMAFTVLAQVHSIYPGRGAQGLPEVLIGAGGLALAREPCKAYDGMAMVTPWGRDGAAMPVGNVQDFEGWIVGRLAQEHGILTWQWSKDRKQDTDLPGKQMVEVGQKIRLWPNHACITGSHFGCYLIVDEDDAGNGDKIIDVWPRARGW
ncbi:hypothetical protein CDD82_7047 [Ophiocordyceps australis]|uniref:D-serine dehydratase-like domain-containing protein n=1 Tax=Ophiocordyceps australis TaxID=1399860 RepID=A0A2C5YSP7_9HYPO|nr:hypothetical protein CDD82_7047 [Ophiocordyceps australis]